MKYNKNAIEAMGSGTTFKEVSGKTMKSVKVRIPADVNYQKRIATLLDSIDTKIENNEKINDNLQRHQKNTGPEGPVFGLYKGITRSTYDGTAPCNGLRGRSS